jgi:hypothetical protein
MSIPNSLMQPTFIFVVFSCKSAHFMSEYVNLIRQPVGARVDWNEGDSFLLYSRSLTECISSILAEKGASVCVLLINNGTLFSLATR